MSGVARATLVSLEAHLGAARGSISGLIDACGSSLTTTEASAAAAPASVLSILQYGADVHDNADQAHVDRGLLTVVWSSKPGLKVHRAPGQTPGEAGWNVVDDGLASGELVVFAGEALSVALGACMRFKAPVHRVSCIWYPSAPLPDANTAVPRISVTFKARVNMDAIFTPPLCRGVAQPAITAREWQRRTLLTRYVNRPTGPLPPVVPVSLEQLIASSHSSHFPSPSDNAHMLEQSAPLGLPLNAWELVLQNVPMLDHARSVQLVCRSWRDVSRSVACESLDCTSMLQHIERYVQSPYARAYTESALGFSSRGAPQLSFRVSAIKELRCTSEILSHTSSSKARFDLPLPNDLQRIVVTVSPAKRVCFPMARVLSDDPGVQRILLSAVRQGAYDLISLAGTSLSSSDLDTLRDFVCQSHESASKGFLVDLSYNELDDSCIGALVSFLQRNTCIAVVQLQQNYFTNSIEKLLDVAGSRKVVIMHDGQNISPTSNLTVRDANNSVVHFKVLENTRFQKIFDDYCSHKSIHVNSVRFIFDTQRLNLAATPADLDMEDGDHIDAFAEQVGD
jgi:hypothetical protein